MKNGKKLAAGILAMTILGGCGGTVAVPEASAPAETTPTVTAPAESVAPTPSPEELAAVEAAEAVLEGFRWPRETEVKTLEGQEVEFTLYHGNGWTLQVPTDWDRLFVHDWRSPSEKAGFGVNKWNLPVNNPKIYRARMGSWRHETDYPAPFDYYYDDDGGYTPPEGNADYVYFFAPAGENSYEFTLYTVVAETTKEEKAIQEAMLLSFTQDESSRVLYTEDYQPGKSEWDFAMAALLVESERLLGFLTEDGWAIDVNGKTTPEYVSHAMALGEFRPGEFVQFGYSERPEGMEEEWPDILTLYFPDSKLWLNFYQNSPWVSVDLAGEMWWTRVSHPAEPEKLPYDVVMAWMQAERAWAKR